MSSSLTLKVANVTSAVTFGKTDQEIAQVLRWYLGDKYEQVPEGLTQAQLNQFYLDAARNEIVAHVRLEAYRNRLRQLQAAQQSLDVQATADTQM